MNAVTNQPDSAAETPLLSPEEYKKQRDKACQQLAGELKYLRLETEYEECLTRIEEAKLRRVNAVAQLATYKARASQQPPIKPQKQEIIDHPEPQKDIFKSEQSVPEQPEKRKLKVEQK